MKKHLKVNMSQGDSLNQLPSALYKSLRNKQARQKHIKTDSTVEVLDKFRGIELSWTLREGFSLEIRRLS